MAPPQESARRRRASGTTRPTAASKRTAAVASTSDNANGLDNLIHPPAKRQQKEPRQKWLARYEPELGLKPLPDELDQVLEASCKFCEVFGREMPNPTEQTAATPSRKKTTNVKVFRSFRKDNIVVHMQKQHAAHWAVFSRMPKHSKDRLSFFTDETTETREHTGTFLPPGASIQLQIPSEIVAAVRRVLSLGRGTMPHSSNRTSNSTSNGNGNGLLIDSVLLNDDGVGGLVPPSEEEEEDFALMVDGSFRLRIRHRSQFEMVVQCLDTSSGMHATARLFTLFGTALGDVTRLGTPQVPQITRYVDQLVALNLTALRRILSGTWTFSVLVGAVTHSPKAYLDVRLALGIRHQRYTFHLMAIPLEDQEEGERMGSTSPSQSPSTAADLTLEVLRHVGGGDILPKLAAITCNDEACRLGYGGSLAQPIRAACGLPRRGSGAGGGRTAVSVHWCASHELQCAVEAMLSRFDSLVGLRMGVDEVVAFIQTHDAVAHEIGACPHYDAKSITATGRFLSDHYEVLRRLQAVHRVKQQSGQWWLTLLAVAELTKLIRHGLHKLQLHSATMKRQGAALTELARSLQLRFQEEKEEEEDTTETDAGEIMMVVSKKKVEQYLQCASIYSCELYQSLEDEMVRNQLVQGTLDAIRGFLTTLNRLKRDVGREVTPSAPVTPVGIAELDDPAFDALVQQHAHRLTATFGPTACADLYAQRHTLKENLRTSSVFRRQATVAMQQHSDAAEFCFDADTWRRINAQNELTLLASFVAGLAVISPGAQPHTMNTDDRVSCGGSVGHYDLVGKLHAKQYVELVQVADLIQAQSD